MMSINVAVVGTLDTKGQEIKYLKECIVSHGCSAIVIDVGILHPPASQADIARETVAQAGGSTLEQILIRKDRRLAVQTMINGAAQIVRSLWSEGKLSGIVSIGGGTGTHIGMGVMRTLPLGLPKLMVSTVASRDMSKLIGTKDITVMHSVIDILGLNAISRKILANAAAAISQMAKEEVQIHSSSPIIGLTSFGFITQGAMRVKEGLERLGYEVAPFHANGTGGMAMEDLIDQGLISGVMDFALHEFADAMYGGYCGDIGPGRLEAAGSKGLPQVVVPGGLDCIVLEFNSVETMPPDLRDRKVFWYDFRSGVRTSRQDMLSLAETISDKLNMATGPTKVVIPLKGFSEADSLGASLYEPATNLIFISELKSRLRKDIEVIEVNSHINDLEFSEVAVSTLDTMMRLMKGQGKIISG
jgi:uncharacterized protein (UPF0261 family)